MARSRPAQRGPSCRVSGRQASKGRAADAAQQNRRERRRGAGAGHAHGMVSASPREVPRCASGASSPWGSRSTRRHDDAALQHDMRVLKTFGLLPGAGRGLRFDRRVEALLEGAPEIGLIVRPLLATWRQLREQIAVFDKAVQRQVKADPICRLLMTVPGIGALSSLVYVSTVEDPSRFTRSRAVGAHLGLTPRRYQSGE